MDEDPALDDHIVFEIDISLDGQGLAVDEAGYAVGKAFFEIVNLGVETGIELDLDAFPAAVRRRSSLSSRTAGSGRRPIASSRALPKRPACRSPPHKI